MKETLRNIQYKNILFPVLAVLLALFISAIIVSILGYSWLSAYQNLLQGAVGNLRNIGETVVRATPLILTGLSFAIGRRCGLINLGAEGQVYMGGMFATIVGMFLPGLPAFIHLPLAILAGMLGGGLLGLLIGWLKTRFGASELITGIMFNYIAILLVGWSVSLQYNGPLSEKGGINPASPIMPDSVVLPRILEGTRISAGIYIAILALIFFYVFLWKTPKGYEIRAAGLNPDAARYSGINVNRNTLLAMFMAGGFAGLAGSVETLGVHLRLLPDFSANFGFDGIAVSLLGNNTPVGIFLSAVLFGMLRSGAQQMQMAAQVPVAVVQIIQALVILFVVGRELYTHVGKFFGKLGTLLKKGGAG